VLDVPAEIGLKRKGKDGEENRFEKENLEFHKRARQAYLALAKKDVERFRVIDGTKTANTVEKMIWAELRSLKLDC
jgi:dTMP kinase